MCNANLPNQQGAPDLGRLEAEGMFSYLDAVAPISQPEEVELVLSQEGSLQTGVVHGISSSDSGHPTGMPTSTSGTTQHVLTRLRQLILARDQKGSGLSMVVVDDASLWAGIVGEGPVRMFLHCCRVLTRTAQVCHALSLKGRA